MIYIINKFEVAISMYIHLGGDMIIQSNKIIAILNHHSKESSEENELFFNKHLKKNNIIFSTANEKTKSIIITDNKIYFSPISSHTLKRRAEVITVLEEENLL